MVEITVKNLEKCFFDSEEKVVLRDINLRILPGEMIAIRGDNGKGKTTLLNIIAGVEKVTKGEVLFRTHNGEEPRIGYVSQDYTSSLLPWFNVLDNVSMPLRLQGVSKEDCRKKAVTLLEGLNFYLPHESYPHQLSGGQKQRVAIARAIIYEPQLLIFDEPFANLDAHTSRDLQETILSIHEQKKPTIILISHGLDHCIYLSKRVLLLNGNPATIYKEFCIPLAYPRTREILFTEGYHNVRSKILAEEEAIYASRDS